MITFVKMLRDAYGFSTYDELQFFGKAHKRISASDPKGCAHYPLRGISSRDSGCDSFRQPLISHVRSRRRHESTAPKIVLELKGKIVEEESDSSSPDREVMDALVSLGLSRIAGKGCRIPAPARPRKSTCRSACD